MRRTHDLMDSVAELVLAANDPRSLAERSLDTLLAMFAGRAAAVFRCEEERVALFASRRIDQTVLDAVQQIWPAQSETLRRGEMVVARPGEGVLSALGAAPSAPQSVLVAPVLEEQKLVGILYLDLLQAGMGDAVEQRRISGFGRILAKALTDTTSERPTPSQPGWETYLERTPVKDMEREKLLLLLERYEWNIARVSRLMGVTRRTIYLRLARYEIPRKRVRKTRPRRATT